MSNSVINQQTDYHHWVYEPNRVTVETIKSGSDKGIVLHGAYKNEAQFWESLGYVWNEQVTNAIGGPDYEC